MTTPRLKIPEIAVGQASKEIAHNEALRVMDALTCGSVKTRIVTTPPVTPTEGDLHIVPSSATGVWAGQTNKLAHFYANFWYFYTPVAGMSLFSIADNSYYNFNGTSWVQNGASTSATFSPLSFGAIGNGVADDTAAIQAAINAGSVDFGDERFNYKVTAIITMPSNRRLIGNGAKITSTVQQILVPAQSYVVGGSITDVLIDGLYFTSTSTALLDRPLVSFNDTPTTKNITVQNCKFVTTTNYSGGLNIGIGGFLTNGSNTQDIKILNNYFDVGGAGIATINFATTTDQNGLKNVLISGNTIKNCGQVDPTNAAQAGIGITISGKWSNINIADNYITNCVYAGIEVTTGAVDVIGDTKITNNTATSCGRNIILNNTNGSLTLFVKNFTITGNLFKDTKIRDTLFGISNSTITDNIFIQNVVTAGNTNHPIVLQAIDKSIISNNKFITNISNDYNCCTQFSDVTNSVIEGNIFESDVGATGVVLGYVDGGGPSFTNNIFSNNSIIMTHGGATRGVFVCGTATTNNKGVNNVVKCPSTFLNLFDYRNQSTQLNNDVQIYVDTGTEIKFKAVKSYAAAATVDISKDIYVPDSIIFTGALGAGWTLTVPKQTRKYTLRNLSGQSVTIGTGTGTTLVVTNNSTANVFVDASTGNVS